MACVKHLNPSQTSIMCDTAQIHHPHVLHYKTQPQTSQC